MVHTVQQNKSFYTARQVKQAEAARRLYAMIGRPSPQDFENIIRLNLLLGCPTTVQDVQISNKIYGPDAGALKGKTTRRKPIPVRNDIVYIPPELIKIHRDVILCIDIMFADGMPLFVSISRSIKFTTIQSIPYRTHDTLCAAVQAISSLYKKAGFEVRTVLADGEFEHLRDACLDLNIHLNSTAANKHVPEIERQIRVIKERARAIWTSLAFQQWPRRLVIELLAFVIFCLMPSLTRVEYLQALVLA